MMSLLLFLLLQSALAVLVILALRKYCHVSWPVSLLGAWGCACDSPLFYSVKCYSVCHCSPFLLHNSEQNRCILSYQSYENAASCLAYSHLLSPLFCKLTPRTGLPPPVTSGDWPARQHSHLLAHLSLSSWLTVFLSWLWGHCHWKPCRGLCLGDSATAHCSIMGCLYL